MHYAGGIREFVSFLNQSKDPVHPDVVYMAGQKDDAMAEVAFQYNDGYSENIVSFANNVHTPEGGMHEEGFKRALTTVLNNYGKKMKILKDDDKVSGEDCREGIACVISVKLTEAQFEGQTKAKLGNSEIRTLVNNIVTDKLSEYLEENPAVGRAILDKALMANRAREAARKARESIRRKTALGGAAMPDKLRDCNEVNPELTELYIVEGDSAGGSATQGRDSRFQAILPLWGKMLNVEKARADKVYGNDKLTPVITALGAGIGDDFDLEKLRYHKVIIMADADVDGSHIRTLLLTFFFRFMRPLIEHGYVYAAVPPLFKLSRGKTTRLAFSEEERDAISAELRGDNPNAKVAHPQAHRAGRRCPGRPDLHRPHGGEGGAPQGVHRAQRQVRRQPGLLRDWGTDNVPGTRIVGADAHIGPTFRCRPGNKNGRRKASAPTKEKIAGNSETPTRNLWGRPLRPPAVNHPITKNVRQIHE